MRRRALAPAVLVFLAFAAYLNALPASFQFDDFNVIVEYVPVHSLAGWFADLKGGLRPLLKLTYCLNWLTGPGPWGFHLVNSLIHAANALLVLTLARRIFPRREKGEPGRMLKNAHPGVFQARVLESGFFGPSQNGLFSTIHFGDAAFFAALVFALHPVRTEAVAYVSGRSVSLMALFYLAAICAYIAGRERGSGALSLVASPALFAAALLVRETAVTLPFALLLMEMGVCRKNFREAIHGQRVHWALFLMAAGAALWHGRVLIMKINGLMDWGGENLLLRQGVGIFYLLSRFASLTGFNIDPDLPDSPALTFATGGKVALLALLLVWGVGAFRRRQPAGFGILWFFLHLMPTNSLLPRPDVASERHLYLAALGLEWALLSTLMPAARRLGRLLPTTTALFCGLLFAATVARNADYRTEITLWEETVAGSPLKARCHVNLGYAYLMDGQRERARSEFERALVLDPGSESARRNLGAVQGSDR